MSDIDNAPVDPFGDLDLAAFKVEKDHRSRPTVTPKVEKEVIRAAAEKGAFVSRQAVAPKPKGVTKSFSLFQQELDVLNDALRAYQANPDEHLGAPSSSDVVRAALHLFATLSPEEQASAIKEHRGRVSR